LKIKLDGSALASICELYPENANILIKDPKLLEELSQYELGVVAGATEKSADFFLSSSKYRSLLEGYVLIKIAEKSPKQAALIYYSEDLRKKLSKKALEDFPKMYMKNISETDFIAISAKSAACPKKSTEEFKQQESSTPKSSLSWFFNYFTGSDKMKSSEKMDDFTPLLPKNSK